MNFCKYCRKFVGCEVLKVLPLVQYCRNFELDGWIEREMEEMEK